MYRDFVVWHHAGILIERIKPDSAFIAEALMKAKKFLTCAFCLNLRRSGSRIKKT